MEPFNHKEEIAIKPTFLVPFGDKCIDCKQYDCYADWCKLFRTCIYNDEKNHLCIESVEKI